MRGWEKGNLVSQAKLYFKGNEYFSSSIYIGLMLQAKYVWVTTVPEIYSKGQSLRIVNMLN